MTDLVCVNKGRWSQEDLDFLRANYADNDNIWLGKKLNRLQHSVGNKAAKLGLRKTNEQRTKQLNKGSERKYGIDTNYFNTIDTSEKVYWLGFIYADGNIRISNSNSKTFSFTLHQKDKEAVYKLKECLKAENPVLEYQYGRRKTASLIISCSEIYDALLSHNIVPNKTDNHVFPTNITSELLNHYVRGLFDGDGCITYNKKSIKSGAFTIVGNKAFCEWLLNNIRKQVEIGGGIYENKGGHIWMMTIGGNIQLSKIAEWLYKDAKFFLTRKYNRFKERGLL